MNFTSADLHIDHLNIIKYSDRPFKTLNEMNETLVRNWNERVEQKDTVFFLGDFMFKSGTDCKTAEYWIKRLNGNIIFVRGNHDNNNSLKTIIDCIHITFANTRINLVHKPEHTNPDFEINLCGHVHDKWRIRSFKEHYDILETTQNNVLKQDKHDWSDFLRRNEHKRDSKSILLNVGVDVQKFRPITLDEALGQVIRYKKIIKGAK